MTDPKGREKHQQLYSIFATLGRLFVWHLNDAVSVVSAEDEAICGQQRHLVLTSPDPRDLPQTVVMITMITMVVMMTRVMMIVFVGRAEAAVPRGGKKAPD